MDNSIYTFIINKNCRNYPKVLFELKKDTISINLSKRFKIFGEYKLLNFSQYSKKFKDKFEVVNGEFKIQGAIGSDLLFVTMPKSETKKIEEIELILENYYNYSD